jgi:3-hydroxymyristoyl/3-hydroxydecanoyl-(acyl carrier protein) dehydratase
MAYIPTGDSDAAAAAETPDTPPAPPVDAPARRVEHIAKLYPNKPADFVFVDAPLAIADDGLSGEFSYCYPTDHPLTAGHFPGSPIMMGVSQLTAVQDAAQWLLHRLREQGRLGELPEKVKVSGQLLALDDALICSVDGLGLRLFADTDVTELTSVKSVSFRRMVRPPEAMRVKVTLSL